MTIPILHAGLTFAGTTAEGHIVRLRPTSREGYWEVTYTRGHRATTEPIPAGAVAPLLADWAAEVDAWISWAAAPRAKNLDRRVVFDLRPD